MKYLTPLLLAILMAVSLAWPITVAQATEGEVLGVHILNPAELEDADALLNSADTEAWHYLTIPLTLADTEKAEEWQQFFNRARERKLIPLVRLTTKFDGKNWTIPTRHETVKLIEFLSKLEWPTDQRHIIVFNEVNHSKEWGGTIDPVSYTETLRFAAEWAKTEQKNFVVMPAAMDLAAPNGVATREAFNYLNQMLVVDPEIFSVIDVWNSHSYPNPGFSSAPTRVAQNSLRGFEYELRFLKEKTGRDFEVFITETGWEENRTTSRWLESYYRYAAQHIWSQPQVKGVTPFVLKGDPGPFSGFSLLDRNNEPTLQYTAFRTALQAVPSLF